MKNYNIKNIVRVVWYEFFVKRILCNIFYFFPIQKNKIFLSNFFVKGYGDNPKYIAEEIIKQNLPFDLVWATKFDYDESLPKQIRSVRYGSIKYFYEYATAKMWIDNVRNSLRTPYKKKGQYYIQTWHGGLGVKKAEKDAENILDPKYIRMAKKDSQFTDIIIAASKWNTSKYMDSFWYTGKVLECGAPKSDVFFRNCVKIKQNICNFFQVEETVKFVLYAPTFRDDGSLDCYNIPVRQMILALEKKWGGKWKLIIRLHPNVNCKACTIIFDKDTLNGNLYLDINEMILASDLLITDYSSCMFDAMDCKKKVLIYATDIYKYRQERGFYFQMEDLPFEVAKTKEELIKIINQFDSNAYESNVLAFKNKMGVFNDGHASERVVEHIKKIML